MIKKLLWAIDEPTILRDMTAEEVVALRMAEKGGHTIQVFSAVNWHDVSGMAWDLDAAYRIKPTTPKGTDT